jgi:uracil-DNA glycosylase
MTDRVTHRRTLEIVDTGTVAERLDAHRARLSACRACAPHEARGRPITSQARAPRVMLVGQAPGVTEAEGGRPFAGRAGRTLFRWLATVGITEAAWREQVYMAAITRCYPGPHPAGRGDRVPAPRERAACAHWLDAELAIIRPRLVVPVGRLAIDRFLGTAPLERLVGRSHVVEHAAGQAVAIPLPHPSGASSWVHEPAHRALLEQALGLLAASWDGSRRAA